MSEDVEPRYQHWLASPASPIPYGIVERWEDRHNGRRDGRKEYPYVAESEVDVPAPPPPAPSTTTTAAAAAAVAVAVAVRIVAWTPYIELLTREAAGRMHDEYIRREQRLAPLDKRLREARTSAESRRDQVVDAVDKVKLAGEPFTDEMLGSRRVVEERRERPAYLSRSRRATEQSRAIAGAEAVLHQIRSLSDQVGERIAGVEAEIDSEKRVAGARARRIDEHCRRRIASYWRHLVRRHPSGHLVIAGLEPGGPTLPAWARETPDAEEESQ